MTRCEATRRSRLSPACPARWPRCACRSASWRLRRSPPAAATSPPAKTAADTSPPDSAAGPEPAAARQGARLAHGERRAHLGRDRQGLRHQRARRLLRLRLGERARPTTRSVLDQVATCFTTGPLKGRTLKLVGHADPRGGSDYNMTLGQSRADAVADYIIGQGHGQGEDRLDVARRDGRDRHRRAELGARPSRRRDARPMTLAHVDDAPRRPRRRRAARGADGQARPRRPAPARGVAREDHDRPARRAARCWCGSSRCSS